MSKYKFPVPIINKKEQVSLDVLTDQYKKLIEPTPVKKP